MRRALGNPHADYRQTRQYKRAVKMAAEEFRRAYPTGPPFNFRRWLREVGQELVALPGGLWREHQQLSDGYEWGRFLGLFK